MDHGATIEVFDGVARAVLTTERREAARNHGEAMARLLSLLGDEAGFEIDPSGIWLYHEAEGHGFETVAEAYDFLGRQDAWSGWRRRTPEEDAE